MKRFTLALAASLVMLAGCDGFREAMTAHVDVVARAGSQELTVERLAELMGSSQIPLSEEAAKAIANLWVNYQLLGRAAANGDSLNDPKLVDEAMWPMLAQQRASKWHDQVRATWSLDTTANESAYMRGDVLGVQHILFVVPEQGLSQGKQDSIKRLADQVARQATAQNFGSLVQKYTMDPGSKERDGFYLVPKGNFVPEFEKAAFDLQPGEITRTPVRTQFGWHIIRRIPYAEIASRHADEFKSMVSDATTQVAESTYLAGIETTGNIKFKDGAAAEIKKVMQAPDEYRDDKAVIATSRAGDFTTGRLARWIAAYPPRQQGMMRSQASSAPDSVLLDFTKQQFLRGELVLAQADSAGVTLNPAELTDARNQFAQLVHRIYTELNITPAALEDSAQSEAQRERVASEMLETYMDQLLHDKVGYVDVPGPVSELLRAKYDFKLNKAGVARSLERAQRVRSAADSVRAQQQPPSQVPMGTPGAPGVQPVPQQQGTPQAPPPQKQAVPAKKAP